MTEHPNHNQFVERINSLISSSWVYTEDGYEGVPSKSLDRLRALFCERFPQELPHPLVFLPTPKLLVLEWRIGHHHVDVELETEGLNGRYQDDNLRIPQTMEKFLDLENPGDVAWLAGQIKGLVDDSSPKPEEPESPGVKAAREALDSLGHADRLRVFEGYCVDCGASVSEGCWCDF